MTNALTALLGAFPHAMVVVDAHGTLTAATPKASELFDVFDGELVGQSWAVVVEAVGLPRRLLGPVQLDGSRVQVRGRIDVDVDSSEGQDGTWVYVFRRPGRRARDQERLHALLMSSAEGSNHGIELTDSDGRFVWVNKSWERLTGYPVAEAVGRTPAELLRSGAHSTAFLREIEDALARGERWQGNVVSRRRDGIDSEMELELWPKRSPQGTILGFVGIRRDLQEERERELLERQLQHVERMAGLGQLAAGVAHEINNPLTYVLANLGWLERELSGRLHGEAREEVLEVIDESTGGAQRIASIVSDLKVFARSRDEETLQGVDVVAACDAAVNLARNQLEHRATVVRTYDRAIALANEVRLVQVVVNLLVNAAHAIPVGDAANNEIELSVTSAGNVVYISVRDTGSGIATDEIQKIFEPFYTTKGQGEGTGLGLSVCLGIVEKMGGRIEVESELGQGSTFTVILHCAAPEEGPTTRDLKRRQQRAPLRVLVVDDEPLIGQSLIRLLRDDDVVVALDGEQALALLKEDTNFDFILCDVMMPGMTGPEVADVLIQRYPWFEHRVAFMTGGVFIPEIRRRLASSPTPCFDKPLDIDGLREWFERAAKASDSR